MRATTARKSPAQLIAELAAARDTMQVLIKTSTPGTERAAQEALINRLRRQITKANADHRTVAALANELGCRVWELVTVYAFGGPVGPTTRLSDRERDMVRTAWTAARG